MSEHHHEMHIEKHGTIKSYIIGFVLSIILTLIPYYMVVNHAVSASYTYMAVLVFAILQFLVQVIFFLHISEEKGYKWNLSALIFTIIVLVILVLGSMWIMYNLDYNMMDH